MKKVIFTLTKMMCAMGLLAISIPVQAQFWGGGISKKAQQQLIEKEKAEHRTVYVNTNAPGVHKEYDQDRGAYVWRDNATGSFLGRDKPSIDKQKEWLAKKEQEK